MDVRTIGVVGAGQMGNGIAHVAAAAGLQVILEDVSDALLAQARAAIEKNLDREIAKGKRTAEEKPGILGRLSFSTDLERLAPVDLVLEAVVEREEVKRELFVRLDGIV